MPYTVTVDPLAGGNGWCIKLNGEIARNIISASAPIITKSDLQGVTYEHESQTYHIPWPA
ncbi:MAG: hypothetical protein V1668_00540 [Patescibacteria group bacterium]